MTPCHYPHGAREHKSCFHSKLKENNRFTMGSITRSLFSSLSPIPFLLHCIVITQYTPLLLNRIIRFVLSLFKHHVRLLSYTTASRSAATISILSVPRLYWCTAHSRANRAASPSSSMSTSGTCTVSTGTTAQFYLPWLSPPPRSDPIPARCSVWGWRRPLFRRPLPPSQAQNEIACGYYGDVFSTAWIPQPNWFISVTFFQSPRKTRC